MKGPGYFERKEKSINVDSQVVSAYLIFIFLPVRLVMLSSSSLNTRLPHRNLRLESQLNTLHILFRFLQDNIFPKLQFRGGKYCHNLVRIIVVRICRLINKATTVGGFRVSDVAITLQETTLGSLIMR